MRGYASRNRMHSPAIIYGSLNNANLESLEA